MADCPYTRGPAHPNRRDTATFEFKGHAPGYTGGGYPRWRSEEHREHTPVQGSESVYVPVHRLCAVAWLFPEDMTAAEILQSGELVGVDVHHTHGMPSVNTEDGLELVEHGRHGEITQARRRAWAEDTKREQQSLDTPDRCDACREEVADPWTIEGVGGAWCLSCARERADGRTIAPVE